MPPPCCVTCPALLSHVITGPRNRTGVSGLKNFGSSGLLRRVPPLEPQSRPGQGPLSTPACCPPGPCWSLTWLTLSCTGRLTQAPSGPSAVSAPSHLVQESSGLAPCPLSPGADPCPLALSAHLSKPGSSPSLSPAGSPPTSCLQPLFLAPHTESRSPAHWSRVCQLRPALSLPVGLRFPCTGPLS